MFTGDIQDYAELKFSEFLTKSSDKFDQNSVRNTWKYLSLKSHETRK